MRSHTGLIVFPRFARVTASFCRDHGIITAKRHQRRTLIAGWWWALGPLVNWVAIATNRIALRRARRLPFPVGEARTVVSRVASPLPAETPEERRARRAVLRTVAAGIGLGIAALVAVVFSGDEPSVALDRRLAIVDALTVMLYAIVGVLITRLLRYPYLRPRLSEGPAPRAIAIGAAIGAATAVIAVGLVSLLVGRLNSDPNVLAVFYDAHWTHIATLVFVIFVVAPVFEEVLFRGLLVESLRSRGRTSAVLGAAVAFAFWHLNPAGLRYYILVGFLLGYVYWRLGLAGSIATHAAFNGLLLVAAALVLSTGTHGIDENGVHIDLPPGWHQVADSDVPADVDVAAESPNGAAVVVAHEDGPGTARVRATPGARSVRQVVVAGISGVRFTAEREGVETDTIVLPRGDRAWVVTFVAGGSGRAVRDFDQILGTLRLYG